MKRLRILVPINVLVNYLLWILLAYGVLTTLDHPTAALFILPIPFFLIVNTLIYFYTIPKYRQIPKFLLSAIFLFSAIFFITTPLSLGTDGLTIERTILLLFFFIFNLISFWITSETKTLIYSKKISRVLIKISYLILGMTILNVLFLTSLNSVKVIDLFSLTFLVLLGTLLLLNALFILHMTYTNVRRLLSI